MQLYLGDEGVRSFPFPISGWCHIMSRYIREINEAILRGSIQTFQFGNKLIKFKYIELQCHLYRWYPAPLPRENYL